MKPGSAPTPPDDEAHDPLLAALRQRLGNYGAPPPPAAWAAIRQRVALPRPWWRRPRRLLPLLALLLSALLVGTLAERRGQLSTTTRPATRQTSTSLPGGIFANKAVDNQNFKQQNASTAQPLAAASAPSTEAENLTVTPLRKLANASPQKATAATTKPLRPSGKTTAARVATTYGQQTNAEAIKTVTQPIKLKIASTVALTARRPRREAAAKSGLVQRAATRQQVARTSGAALVSGVPGRRQLSVAQPLATETAGSAAPQRHGAGRARQAAALARPQYPYAPTNPRWARIGRLAPPAYPPPTSLAAASASSAPDFASTGRPETVLAQPPLPLLAADLAERGQALGLLALKQPSLLLPELAGPAALVARPDSAPPAPPVRRWALLVLAGPTLSYRTLGPAPALAVGHPDYARLERPALGLGAQVQVRRVLSGRWALAAGLGYHEYATRLALTFKDTTTSVHRRDTYRLLTLPVQFTYALGAPRGRLTTGLLLGAEPSLYLGGRSTEGSTCACEQQAYTSAAASPYRPWSMAFSLGLDLRYQLGGPASRWRWVVQPTGRYVATPFVRSEAVGFTRRQPWSLGLLTGFSWDVR